MPTQAPDERPLPGAFIDPEASAEHAGLHYVTDADPGYVRRPHGKGFTYQDAAGTTVSDASLRKRFDALVIPPAWTDVWICESPLGHLQATGRDERGRKQYIYHTLWDRVRNETKFSRMVPFGECLPLVRERAEADLRKRGLPREKVLATVVTLLDTTLIRIGNDTYAKENKSFGLTTLRDRHVAFDGSTCTFSFRGKSGKEHSIQLDDRRLARIVRQCRDITGYHLFQYVDEAGARNAINSQDVNEYLRDTTGQTFTAKDFRTWGGSVHAAAALIEIGPAASETATRKNLIAMVKAVAERLGNTTAVCRKYYIHPALFAAYETGTLFSDWKKYLRRKTPDRLEEEEGALLHFLREHYAA